MKDLGIRQGSAAFAVPVVGKSDAVYVHTDIEQIEPPAGEEPTSPVYQYHEYVYDPEEYIELIGNENTELKESLENVTNELTTTQLALVDVYELIGGAE